jgi:hypothetical protein
MKSYVIHRRDGYVVGLVTTAQDDGPTLVGVGAPDQIVTEVDLPADAIAFSGEDIEKQAVEAVQAFRIEHHLVRGGAGGGGKAAK